MKLFYKGTVGDYFYDVYYYFLHKIKLIYRGIGNLITWLPIIWCDNSYHYSYFFKLLQFKLNRMYKLFSNEKLIKSIESRKEAKNILICKLLLERLITDNYHDNINTNVLFQKSRSTLNHSDYMRQQDLKYFGKMIEKHVDYWWD